MDKAIAINQLAIGDKLRSKASCQDGKGDKSTGGCAPRFGREGLTISFLNRHQ